MPFRRFGRFDETISPVRLFASASAKLESRTPLSEAKADGHMTHQMNPAHRMEYDHLRELHC